MNKTQHPASFGDLASEMEVHNLPPEPEKKKQKKGFFYYLLTFFSDLFITAGVFIALFVVWQVVWTNFAANNEQREVIAQVQKDFGKIPEKVATPQKEVVEEKDNFADGSVYAVLHIPKFGYDYAAVIREGVSKRVLDSGAFGHYPETVLAGNIGNFSVAAHREIYGAKMLHVDKLKAGDPIVVETRDTWYVYKMVDYELVQPADSYVVAADPYIAGINAKHGKNNPVIPKRRLLTITTCHPPYVADKRWIVHAELAYTANRAEGMPKEIIDPKKQKSLTEDK